MTRLLSTVAVVVLLAGLAVASVLSLRPSDHQESAYIACAGVGDPADIGVCVPAPYPERLPLPDPDDIPT